MDELLRVDGLHTTLSAEDENVYHVLRDVSFRLQKNEVLGIVGESGSGKSMLMKSIMGLLPDGAQRESGSIFLNGTDISAYTEKEMWRVRGAEIAMIFQDPMTALNPLRKVGYHLEEVIERHQGLTEKKRRATALRLLTEVGFVNPETSLRQYPHELSGGMRQRLLIAMAIACRPDIIIADEPTTALDVTIQAQILNLLDEVKRRGEGSMILITHDLGVIAGICDRVAVMYGGRIMETGTVDEIFYRPLHPYTVALLNAAVKIEERKQRRLNTVEGMPPELAELGDRCPFYPRCDRRSERCKESFPIRREVSETHSFCCHMAEVK